MWYLKKIISWFLVFAILIFSLCVPAFAITNPVPTDSRGDFYDWVINSGSLDEDRPGGPFGPGHHGGGRFSKERYDEWVSDLPAAGITSSGKLIWQARASNLYGFGWIGVGRKDPNIKVDASSVDLSAVSIPVSHFPDFSESLSTIRFQFSVTGLPVNGVYSRCKSLLASARHVTTDSSIISETYNYPVGSAEHHFETDSLPMDFYWTTDMDGYAVSSSFLFYMPVYEVIPDSVIDFSSDTQYNVNTRPTTITGGNYGIVGDDNQITTVNDNRKIVNEGDNIYYNPATGQTQNITDWSYDYSSRIYNITLDTGDKVSVEYGDENISIVENKVVEGDTIVNNYTIYYMIEGSGDNPDPTPGPTSCPHDWQAGSTVDPTCTASGKTVYICSKCGETKTEILPALGHDWQVVRTVPTEYDENGNQTQAGYTLYECSRCGNQYKDEDSTGPPGDGTPDDGGLIAWLNGLIKHLSDNLSGVVALIKRFFTEIPELFGGFTAFLAAVFPFLPDEIILLLTFGMAALVVVGVIKAIRR